MGIRYMRMLYRAGTQTKIWDISLDSIIVEDHEIDAYLSMGWVLHPFDLIKTPEPELQSVIPEVEDTAEPDPVKTVVTKAKKGRKHVV